MSWTQWWWWHVQAAAVAFTRTAFLFQQTDWSSREQLQICYNKSNSPFWPHMNVQETLWGFYIWIQPITHQSSKHHREPPKCDWFGLIIYLETLLCCCKKKKIKKCRTAAADEWNPFKMLKQRNVLRRVSLRWRCQQSVRSRRDDAALLVDNGVS